MTPGDKFELHGQKWECVQDLGGNLVLACNPDTNSVRQVFVVDVCINRESGESVEVFGQ